MYHYALNWTFNLHHYSQWRMQRGSNLTKPNPSLNVKNGLKKKSEKILKLFYEGTENIFPGLLPQK